MRVSQQQVKPVIFQGNQDQPIWKGLFFSLLLHALVLTMMVTFALWKEKKHDQPLTRIEVTIVSNKQLATLQQRANPVDRPESKSAQAMAKPVEPESITSPQAVPKPAAKPAAATRPISKPETAPRPAVKPQTTTDFETVLKPEALTNPITSPEAAPEPIVNPEQASEAIAKSEPAMKPVVKFKPASQPIVKLETPARPVLKLKAEPEAVIDKTTLSKPVADLEPKPVSVSNTDSGTVPVSRPKRATLPMSAPVAKPVTKLKLLPMVKPETDPNYDPFSPMESDSDQKYEALSKQARISETQLSQKEINHYIGRIQAAVEKQWRVPVAIYNITDPLVEMILQPGGQIQSLFILESSGNATLDTSLIRAIQAAAPFDIPKEHFEYFRVNRIRFHPF